MGWQNGLKKPNITPLKWTSKGCSNLLKTKVKYLVALLVVGVSTIIN